MSDFAKELEHLINRHSQENGSNTPDFILADYLIGCLEAFEMATKNRDAWHGFKSRFSTEGEPVELPSEKRDHDAREMARDLQTDKFERMEREGEL